MPEQPQLIYLEPDDEITSVVRRLRAAESGSVVIVAPGRSRATSSAVALRLLAQVAAEEARTISLVADAPTRAVATKAGIAAFASVAEATSGAVPDDAPAPPSAPIRVVRTASEVAVSGAQAPRSGAGDETMAVRVRPKPAGRGGQPSGRRRRLPRWPWLAGLLVIALAAGAALLPGATVHITPATVEVEPASFPVEADIAGHLSEHLQAATSGTATGQRLDQVAANGVVTFSNWNTVSVEIPQGTHVSVGGTTAFVTLQRVVVPRGRFGAPIEPGQKSVEVAAFVPGPGGNVAARAIDTIDDASVKSFLRGFPDNPNRLVVNDDPTEGGLEISHPVILQSDIDAAMTAIRADLQGQLDDALAGESDRIYAGPPAAEAPSVEVPEELLGTEDQPTFELTGTLDVDRPYVSRADVVATATSTMLTLGGNVPSGTVIVEDSIVVVTHAATLAGERLAIQVSVTALAATRIDEAQVRDRISGMTVTEARAELASLGEIDVDLWPAWVDRLPRLTFRIEIVEEIASPSPSP